MRPGNRYGAVQIIRKHRPANKKEGAIADICWDMGFIDIDAYQVGVGIGECQFFKGPADPGRRFKTGSDIDE